MKNRVRVVSNNVFYEILWRLLQLINQLSALSWHFWLHLNLRFSIGNSFKMFNRAVNAFRKGIHRKSSPPESQDDDFSITTTYGDDEDDEAAVDGRLSVRSTPSSFRLLNRGSSCCDAAAAIAGSMHSSEGIISIYRIINCGWFSVLFVVG